MEKAVLNKILDAQQLLLTDEAYRALHCEYTLASAEFLKLMEQLPRSQRDTIWDYLGVCTEMHIHFLEKVAEQTMN